MNTLFISTYSNLLTIGLLLNGKILDIKENISEKSHSTHLIPLLETILNDNKLDIKDINEIIVVNGPGSFTGVRLGITVAKTLSYTLNIPIKTITSIEALGISCDEKIITVDDNKGKYVGGFENNNLKGEIEYLSSNEFNIKYKDYSPKDIKLDLEKIYDYVKGNESLNPHEVKPIYIKTIEVEK